MLWTCTRHGINSITSNITIISYIKLSSIGLRCFETFFIDEITNSDIKFSSIGLIIFGNIFHWWNNKTVTQGKYKSQLNNHPCSCGLPLVLGIELFESAVSFQWNIYKSIRDKKSRLKSQLNHCVNVIKVICVVRR